MAAVATYRSGGDLRSPTFGSCSGGLAAALLEQQRRDDALVASLLLGRGGEPPAPPPWPWPGSPAQGRSLDDEALARLLAGGGGGGLGGLGGGVLLGSGSGGCGGGGRAARPAEASLDDAAMRELLRRIRPAGSQWTATATGGRLPRESEELVAAAVAAAKARRPQQPKRRGPPSGPWPSEPIASAAALAAAASMSSSPGRRAVPSAAGRRAAATDAWAESTYGPLPFFGGGRDELEDDEALFRASASPAAGAEAVRATTDWQLAAQETADLFRSCVTSARVEVVAGGLGAGAGAHQLRSPLGVAAGADGSVLVADTGNARVVCWRRGSQEGEVLLSGSRSGDQPFEPISLLLDGSGSLVVSASGSVEIWSTGGRSCAEVTGGTWPTGLAWEAAPGAAGTRFLFVDTFGGGITRCSVSPRRSSVRCQLLAAPRGAPRRAAAGPAAGSAALSRPFGLAAGRSGEVLVADSGNHRVLSWPVGGGRPTVVAGGNGQGSGMHQLSHPRGVVMEASGAVLVADTGNNRVVRWPRGAQHGELVLGAGGCGLQLDQLNRPVGLAVDAEGCLLVADSGNCRILRCALRGAPAHRPPPPAAASAGRPPPAAEPVEPVEELEEPWAKDILDMIKDSFHPARSKLSIGEIFGRLQRLQQLDEALTPSEFDKIVRSYRPELSQRSVRRLFALVNRSGSGRISRAEFERRFGTAGT